ncbi:MAG: hypothetical protein KDK65_00040 [Chlamydiia bacterium]|nr:hypothetical protein [Chlamydiia bacterium]
MIRWILFLLPVFLFGQAELCFLVIDLKYNDHNGVKICEIQEGTRSSFLASHYIFNQPDIVSKQIEAFLSQYQKPIWATKNIWGDKYVSQLMSAKLPKITLSEPTSDFIAAGIQPLNNPESLSDYNGILITIATQLPDPSVITDTYPSMLVLNRAILPHVTKKDAIADYLDHEVRPQAKTYPRVYSPQLITEILNDFTSDLLVIKPLIGSRGRGILIVTRQSLRKTLQTILGNPEPLRLNPDQSYNYWSVVTTSHFLIEEFIPSNPVLFDGRYFDPTIRVLFFLTKDNHYIDVHFLNAYCKLPKRGLTEIGTLTDKHKSYLHPPYFKKVDPLTRKKIEDQLRPSLINFLERITAD